MINLLDEHQNLGYIKKLISFVTLKLNVRPGKYLKKTVDSFFHAWSINSKP